MKSIPQPKSSCETNYTTAHQELYSMKPSDANNLSDHEEFCHISSLATNGFYLVRASPYIVGLIKDQDIPRLQKLHLIDY